MIEQQAYKFEIQVKSASEPQFRQGHPSSEDLTKNLFKIFCGIFNMRLRQRGINQLEDKLLISYLDAINFDIHDNDLILLNQMATIKSLVNRKSFSISDKQISMIHKKFLNIYHQRLSHNGGALILDDEEERPKSHHGFEAKRAPTLPKELEYHELEESREYRHAQDLERSRSRSGIRRPGSRIRKHEDSYIGRGSHHAGSFIASPAQPK